MALTLERNENVAFGYDLYKLSRRKKGYEENLNALSPIPDRPPPPKTRLIYRFPREIVEILYTSPASRECFSAKTPSGSF